MDNANKSNKNKFIKKKDFTCHYTEAKLYHHFSYILLDISYNLHVLNEFLNQILLLVIFLLFPFEVYF